MFSSITENTLWSVHLLCSFRIVKQTKNNITKKYKHASNAYVAPVIKFNAKSTNIGLWTVLNSVIFFKKITVPLSSSSIICDWMMTLSNASWDSDIFFYPFSSYSLPSTGSSLLDTILMTVLMNTTNMVRKKMKTVSLCTSVYCERLTLEGTWMLTDMYDSKLIYNIDDIDVDLNYEKME